MSHELVGTTHSPKSTVVWTWRSGRQTRVMYVYITRLRRWGSGYNNDKKNPIEDYNAKSILRRRFPQVNRNSLNFQAVKMEKNETPESKCTTREFTCRLPVFAEIWFLELLKIHSLKIVWQICHANLLAIVFVYRPRQPVFIYGSHFPKDCVIKFVKCRFPCLCDWFCRNLGFGAP